MNDNEEEKWFFLQNDYDEKKECIIFEKLTVPKYWRPQDWEKFEKMYENKETLEHYDGWITIAHVKAKSLEEAEKKVWEMYKSDPMLWDESRSKLK